MATAVLTNGDRLEVPKATVQELTAAIFSLTSIEPPPSWLLEQRVDMNGSGLWLRLEVSGEGKAKASEVGISPLHVVRVDP